MSLAASYSLPSRPPHMTKVFGAELGGEVDVAQDLAQGEAADAAVVGGEAAVLEDRVAEQVGGDHRDDHAGGLQRAR